MLDFNNSSVKMKVLAMLSRPDLLTFVLLIVVVTLFQILSDGILLGSYNLSNILTVLPEIGLVVIGAAILMIAGEFDLSVGSVFALAPMIVFSMADAGWGFNVSIPVALLSALLIGYINGYISIKFKLPSFITTLGMLFIVRSLTVSASGGFPPSFSPNAPEYLFSGDVGPLNMAMIWFFTILFASTIFLRYTNYGTWLYATGGQEEVAKSVGIKTTRVKICAFMFCSFLAGLAGLIQVFRLHSPLPSLGEGLELQVIAAAVVGGVALTGGIGSALGAVLGLMILKIIENGLILTGVDANWFKFAIGAIMICVVIFNAFVEKSIKNISEAK
jgi:ribose/xylose/arabinose/galactoside ABC-type transport system permease subunit